MKECFHKCSGRLRTAVHGWKRKGKAARPSGRAAEAELVFGLLLEDEGVSGSEQLSQHEQVISAKRFRRLPACRVQDYAEWIGRSDSGWVFHGSLVRHDQSEFRNCNRASSALKRANLPWAGASFCRARSLVARSAST